MMTKEDALREAGVPIEPELTPSQSILTALKALGYSFRLNLCGMVVEVNGHPLSDLLEAEIRTQMRDRGVKSMNAVEDAYKTDAKRNSYHPIRDYFKQLKWDGEDHISVLASKITSDNDPVIYDDGAKAPLHAVYLYRWMIGAVAKVMHGEQNPMLTWDGPQGIGKSLLARWLCPKQEWFIEAPINPQDKDCDVRLMSLFIWEVSELDATTRKADVSALKAFITKGKVTVRKSYGRNDVSGAAMCSFIGTVNNTTGFLADETGSRRFYICRLTHIDWSYRDLDVDQLWAQAVSEYQAGASPHLTREEKAAQAVVNQRYEVETPIEDWLQQYFTLTGDPDDLLSMGEIITHLAERGVRLHGSERAQSMELGRVLPRLGSAKVHTRHGKRWSGLAIKHA
jgi:putative DNA primase/helicase